MHYVEMQIMFIFMRATIIGIIIGFKSKKISENLTKNKSSV